MHPLISICIPAYKNVAFLKRLLESIAIQEYRDYEVIVSDDSPDLEVQQLVDKYKARLQHLSYWRNEPAKGMPGNWNFALQQAKGAWIKIMHDDDWLAGPDSLTRFAQHTETDTDADFIFCDYENVFFNEQGAEKGSEMKLFPGGYAALLRKEPLTLFADNKIGPPSVCMIRNGLGVFYDERLRWRVDIDYYARILGAKPAFIHIDQPLVKVGMNHDQVTNITKNRPEVELPEAYILLKKYGLQPLSVWQVYDGWWRMLRNMHIYSQAKLQQYVSGPWDPAILNMVDFLGRVPRWLLHWGVSSKLLMGISYLTNKARRLPHA